MSSTVLLIIIIALYFAQRSELNNLRKNFEQQLQQLRQHVQVLQQQLQKLTGEPDVTDSTSSKSAETLTETNAATAVSEIVDAPVDAALDVHLNTLPLTITVNTAISAQATAGENAAPNTSVTLLGEDNIVDEKSPSITSSIGASIVAWFKGGNTIVRLAVVIIFIGVAFLLRYAAEHAVFPIEVRLAAVALGAAALAGFGWRVRHTRHGYGVTLQGAGIGVLYLTVFAALRLYALIPPALAFPLLIALAVITALLALLQDALALAVFGFTGAFLAPVLASTGEGSHVVLFSYFLIINLAIAWIAQLRAWKLLNLVGFFFTFTLGIGWGLRAWQPELLLSTEPFLIAHLLLYLWISVGYSRQLAMLEQPKLPYVDGTLVFGTPIIAFGLQAGMMKHIPLGLACSAAVMAAIYLWIGLRLWRQMGEKMRLLSEGMLALGVVFLFLIAPLALDARWTSAAWALQGAGVAWIAVRQRRTWALAMGLLMQFGAAISFYNQQWPEQTPTLFLNALYFGVLILALAALFTARNLVIAAQASATQTTAPSIAEKTDVLQSMWTRGMLLGAHWLMLSAGLLWLLDGTWREIFAATWDIDKAHRLVGLLALLALFLEASHRRLKWAQFAAPARVLMPAAFGVALVALVSHLTWFSGAWKFIWFDGVIEFIGLIALGIWLLRRVDKTNEQKYSRRSYAIEHVIAGWSALLQSGLLVYEFAAHFIARHEMWTPVALIVPATLITLAALKRLRQAQWPSLQHPLAWLQAVSLPWLLLLLLWSVGVNLFSDGSMAPLPYVPLLNPIDLGHALIVLFAFSLMRTYRYVEKNPPRWLPILFVGAAFWWLNSALIRSLYQWSDTPLWLDGALQYDLVQTSLSILWTLTALATMFIATQRAPLSQRTSQWRLIWVLGASLLGVVVVKLLLVDMSNSGTLQRIVSFLGVGLLMLVIGYVAPLPPARDAKKSIEAVPL
ncbi:MAG: hypothetical protein JWM78_3305 [Verrucomicrobiaceae bacterium]|nr:hypothetical protein [Verrucomicrobiaceae bacterium]